MKPVAQNRRARYDYEITDTIEAGIKLTGQEVKSCRQGNISLAGAYVSLQGEAPVLRNASISPYVYASDIDDYNPGRERVLLLKKNEMQKLESALNEKGVTVVPLEVRSGRFIKVLLGVGRGKKRHDKRQKIRDRDVSRKLKRGEDY